MKRKNVFWLAGILVLVVGIGHALMQKQDQEQQEIIPPSYTVDVVVTNIEVIVTDKKGQRVTDLKPENFRIYEDGLLREVSNFYEFRGLDVLTSAPEEKAEKPAIPQQQAAQPLPQARNKIVIYFDNWHLDPMGRNWSIEKLEPFIRNNFSDATGNTASEGMVVCLDQSLEVLQDFTSDPDALLEAVDKVKTRSGQGLLRRREKAEMKRELNRIFDDITEITKGRRELAQSVDRASLEAAGYDRALGMARNYTDAEEADLRYSLNAINAFIGRLAGLDGRKVLLYVSDGLPLKAGEEIFTYLGDVFPGKNIQMETMSRDATRAFKELTARCNAYEIALYPISAQGLESSIVSADMEGELGMYKGRGSANPITSLTKNESLKLMAQDTGGVAIVNTNKIEEGLEEIQSDLRFYYSIGYRSLYGEDDKFHAIKVELEDVDEKYDVRVRRGYVRSSGAEKIRQSVFSRLFLPQQQNLMGFFVQALPIEKMQGSDKLKLTLKFLFPIRNLALFAKDNAFYGRIKIHFTLMDEDKRVSSPYELTEDIVIPAKDYEIAMKSRYPYLAEMYVNPGQYTISVAVEDIQAEQVSYLQFFKSVTAPE